MRYDDETIEQIQKHLNWVSEQLTKVTAVLAGNDMDVTTWNQTPIGSAQYYLASAIELLTEEGEE